MREFSGMLIVASLFVFAAGCGGSASESEEELTPSCQAIADACHELDTGPGEIRDCHESSESSTEEQCAATKDDCLAKCVAK
jgi:hypothetical protein